MIDSSPKQTYTLLLQQYEQQLARLRKKHSRLGWIRLGVILAFGLLAYLLFFVSLVAGLAAAALGVGLFLWVVSVDTNNNAAIRHTALLASINREELEVLAGGFMNRYNGLEHAPLDHPYAGDLDLFGPASIYQLVQRCSSEQGRAYLAKNLLQPQAVTIIGERQEAVRELVPLNDWRQQWGAYAAASPITVRTEQRLKAWLQEKSPAHTGTFWELFLPLYAVITIATLVATIAGLIPASVFSFLFLVFLAFSSFFSKAAVEANVHLSGVVKETETFYRLIRCMEAQTFRSALLLRWQQRMGSGEEKVSKQLSALGRLLNRFDLRLNVFVFIFLNSFLLWDVRQLRALNRWKEKNREAVPHWFELIAEMELLHSLATLQFNNPDWCMPRFVAEHMTLEGRSIGHPLIPRGQRVVNDFGIRGGPAIALVTGSNMAGKSTFLRSLGVNTVLAQMGAPVCASSWLQSPVQLMSSMRIADNLTEQTSTFYAELKKLKTIIEAVQRKEPVFLLLDEILRGTNSLDRHTGSKALIRQLVRQGAVAVLATHDVELAQLGQEFPQAVVNYHFDVQVAGEELYFDYLLKEGVCTSLNASLLMRKIGIELPED